MKKQVKGAKPSQVNKQVPISCATCALVGDIRPSWRFGSIGSQPIKRYAFPDDASDRMDLIQSLQQFESRTIRELRGDRNSNRYAVYRIADVHDKLDRDVKEYLIDHGIEEVHRFRTGSRERVYAISLDRGVFDLIWWDPMHKIYSCD